MKILIAAAAGMAALLLAAAPAEAQTMKTTTVTHDGGTTTRTTVRHTDNGWHGRWRWRTTCRTWWRHGHKYRTCRKVRVRW